MRKDWILNSIFLRHDEPQMCCAASPRNDHTFVTPVAYSLNYSFYIYLSNYVQRTLLYITRYILEILYLY